MGYALAEAAAKRKYQVHLVSGPTNLKPPAGVKFYSVTTALQMRRVCRELFSKVDGLIMTAAVCDFMPETVKRHKIPSSKGTVLKLKKTPDILAGLAKKKGGRTVIGFCLETRDLINRAIQKVESKRLNGIVANYYDSKKNIPFGLRKMAVSLVGADGKVLKEPKQSKDRLAGRILDWMEFVRKREIKTFFK